MSYTATKLDIVGVIPVHIPSCAPLRRYDTERGQILLIHGKRTLIGLEKVAHRYSSR
jgi:hypothetical protein